MLSTEEIEKRIKDSYELPNWVLEAVPDPMVTVRTSTYNHAHYIRQCIEGVLMQQTTFPFEFIIGEDFSTDGTREIVLEYAKQYPKKIRVMTADYNVGMKANGFRCIRASRGKYIALCEGDDYWTDPLKLQKQVDFMEENSDYVSCYHDAMIVDDKGNIVKASKLPDKFKKDFSSEEISKGAWILTLTHCFRNVLKDIPHEFAHIYNGDTFYHSLLGNFGKGKYMADIEPAVYRLHSGSIWSSLDESIQLYHNGVTQAWMYRYYKRIGKIGYAEHYKNQSIICFQKTLGIFISNHRVQHKDIVNNISSHYTDIIVGSSNHEFRELLKQAQHIIRVREFKNLLKKSLLVRFPWESITK